MLRFEAIGFLLLITLSWLDELVSLPHLLFGSPRGSNWQEAILETAALIAVWLVVYVYTKDLGLGHRSIKVCIWCRKISDGHSWLATEEFFHRSQVASSHCACPECRKKWERYLDTATPGYAAES